MAKIEGTQSIPSELLDIYRANITEPLPDGTIRKRFPYRLPKFQEGGSGVTQAQKDQRERFKEARTKFKEVAMASRSRWYEAMPQWHSLLWYYNYWMMSALDGVLGGIAQGAVVIRSIQNLLVTVPNTGVWATFPSAVDPSKVVVMIWGAAYSHGYGQEGDYPYAWAWPVYPVWASLASQSVSVGWAIQAEIQAAVALQIIEYI